MVAVLKLGKATITVSRLHEKFTLEEMKGIQKKLKNENSSENWKVKLVEAVRINGKRLKRGLKTEKSNLFPQEVPFGTEIKCISLYLPSATKLRRLCFYRRVSVHIRGGVCLSACWDTTPRSRPPNPPPQEQTPPGVDPPGADTPPEQAPPQSRHPPE